MKKTAVEWLVDEYFGGIDSCTSDFRYYIKKAKEMEKQQIKNAWLIDGYYDSNEELGNAEFEQYYNETFKN